MQKYAEISNYFRTFFVDFRSFPVLLCHQVEIAKSLQLMNFFYTAVNFFKSTSE